MLVKVTVIKTMKGPKPAEPSKCRFFVLELDGEFIDPKNNSFQGWIYLTWQFKRDVEGEILIWVQYMCDLHFFLGSFIVLRKYREYVVWTPIILTFILKNTCLPNFLRFDFHGRWDEYKSCWAQVPLCQHLPKFIWSVVFLSKFPCCYVRSEWLCVQNYLAVDLYCDFGQGN